MAPTEEYNTMGLFSKFSTEGHEETEERVGGGGFTRETDIYKMKIKMAYAGASDGGAQNVTFIFDDGKEIRETVYVTSKTGANFYHPKKPGSQERDTTKKVTLPGWDLVDQICIIASDIPLTDQNTEEKVVNIYDKEAKRELPKNVQVFVDLLGKDVSLAIYKVLANKTEQQGTEYVDIAETREFNEIEKVFHPEYNVTLKEAKTAAGVKDGVMVDANDNPVAVFYDKWLEAHKGKVKDKRTIKEGEAGKTGRPGAAKAHPGAAGGTSGGAPRKSLFGG